MATCAGLIADDFVSRIRSSVGASDSGGATHAWLQTDQSLQYIRRVFRDYKSESGLPAFHGRIAELGPGDNCGVALLFIADGAASVDLIDRFYSIRDPEKHAKIYRRLIEDSPRLRARYAGATDERSFTGISWHHGKQASVEQFFANDRAYDFVVSRAVLEHVRDPQLAIIRMARGLKPAGMMLHAVDLRDHGMFSRSGCHEMKFYELPTWLYGLMVDGSGRPNRFSLGRYRRAFARAGLEARFRVTSLVGGVEFEHPIEYEKISLDVRASAIEFVRTHRSRFAPEFAVETDEDLSISGFFAVAKRRV